MLLLLFSKFSFFLGFFFAVFLFSWFFWYFFLSFLFGLLLLSDFVKKTGVEDFKEGVIFDIDFNLLFGRQGLNNRGHFKSTDLKFRDKNLKDYLFVGAVPKRSGCLHYLSNLGGWQVDLIVGNG